MKPKKETRTYTADVTRRMVDVIDYLVDSGTVSSHKELAEKMELSPGAISHMVKGTRNTSIEYVAKICDTFDISAEWLITGKGTMKSIPKKVPIKERLQTVTMLIRSIENDL